MDRRNFMGFAVVGAPLAALVGSVGTRTLEQFEVLPLPPPPVAEIEWLNGFDPVGPNVRLGRYRAPLTENLLLEAIRTCGIEKPRTVTVSTAGCMNYVLFTGSGRRNAIEVQPWRTVGYDEDSLLFFAPGKRLKIEVHFGLPDGFLTIA